MDRVRGKRESERVSNATSHAKSPPEQNDRRSAVRGSRRAALAAACVILAGGVFSRWLSAAYDASNPPVLGPGALDRIPMQIGSWTGRPRPLDEAIVRAADLDSYVLRSYSRLGRESVGLYVGFGIRVRDLAPHRPEVCYPGNGYTLREQHALRIAAGKSELPARLLVFSSAGLGATNVAVLTFYIVDGRIVDDVSGFRWRMWAGQNAADYVAQVQITTVFGTEERSSAARSVVEEFAADAATLIVDGVIAAVAEAKPPAVPSDGRAAAGER